MDNPFDRGLLGNLYEFLFWPIDYSKLYSLAQLSARPDEPRGLKTV